MSTPQRFRRSRLALAVGAAMAAGAGAFCAPALAATFIVTLPTDTPDGGTSLREAVNEANINPGIDIIEFDPSLIGSTIETNPALRKIEVFDSLVVQGPGSDNLTIMPSDDFGNAVLFNHSGADVSVSVTGLTIDGGGARGSHFAIGGGSSGTSFTASDVVIENFGNATSPFYLFNDDISISDSIFRNNSSSESGAMVLVGDEISISNVQVTGNSSSSSFSVGGIFLRADISAEIVDSVITGNQTSGRGGGMSVAGTGEITINGTTVADNTAELGGGGIYWRAITELGALRIIDSTISGNTTTTADLVHNASAGSGGGLLIDSQTMADYELEILQSTFSGNTAAGAGGGMFVGLRTSGTTIDIAHSTITDNTAEFSGGLLAITDSTTPDAADVEVSHTVIAGNTGSTDGTDAGDSTGETGGDVAIGDTINATYSFLDMVGTNVNEDMDSTVSGGDPGLGALAVAPYGNRKTAVHIPDESSPLVDAGDGSLAAGSGDVPVNDQTGIERIVNGIIDIGAVEFNPDPPASGGGGGGGAIGGGLLGLLAGLLFRRRRLRE